MNIAIIAARGGSKRIKKKNIKNFKGKPIIFYSIKAAIKSNCFKRVIVTTDDLSIAKIAKKYGAEVPFIRSKKLSKDSVSNRQVIQDVLKRINLDNINYVCQIFAAAPFIRAEDIKKSLKELKKNPNADFCFTVSSYPHPIQRSLKINSRGRIEMFYPKFRNYNSQDLAKSYHDAAQFYWGKLNSIRKNKITFSKISIPFIIPRYRSIDIDDFEDWKQALMMSKYLF